MACEWSHTNEAYEYAREQVFDIRHDVLAVIYAEWMTDFRADNWESIYNAAREHAYALEPDILANLVWDKAKEQRTCDNGGFNAWVCPFGCHTVPFEPRPETMIPNDGYADGGCPYTDEELSVINP